MGWATIRFSRSFDHSSRIEVFFTVIRVEEVWFCGEMDNMLRTDRFIDFFFFWERIFWFCYCTIICTKFIFSNLEYFPVLSSFVRVKSRLSRNRRGKVFISLFRNCTVLISLLKVSNLFLYERILEAVLLLFRISIINGKFQSPYRKEGEKNSSLFFFTQVSVN